ncbi:hypothetical protein FH972_022297 [Carpinus fangiana]|uniref:Calcineurin-like phosphoesterase domain-containing protein n=1 Tax=Carpinus fangiana TaxID=176857 RepID=A0A5N6KRV1_9ROSI|nr:hypothetical protein FH972_022297 [Carpinus fangiana]
MASSRVKTTFLVISDTHSVELTSDIRTPFRLPTARADVVLLCGDITENGGLENHEAAVAQLVSIDAELKLVIPGNHDVDLDEHYCRRHGIESTLNEQAIKLWKSEETRSKGIVFLDEGVHEFALTNGAHFTIYASPWTPKHGDSAFQYASGDRWNSAEVTESPYLNTSSDSSVIPANIDIIMTHGPPKYVLDGNNSAGCEHLWNAIRRTKPRMHCFGHVHGGYGHHRVLWTNLNADEIDEESGSSHAIAPTTRLNRRLEGGRQVTDGKLDLMPTFVSVGAAKKRGYAELKAGDLGTQGQETLFVNAALTDEGVFTRPPWLIELELEGRETLGEDCSKKRKRHSETVSVLKRRT